MLPLTLVLVPRKFSVLVKGTEKKHRRALCSIAVHQFEKPVGDCQWVMSRRFFCEVLEYAKFRADITNIQVVSRSCAPNERVCRLRREEAP